MSLSRKQIISGLIGSLGILSIIVESSLRTVYAESTPINSAPEYLERGIIHSEQNNFLEAIENYNQALALDSNNALAYYNRGLAFYYLRNHAAALADFSKTLELKPNLAIVYQKRGLVLMYLGDYDGAIADFERAIELEPDNANIYVSRGLATMLPGKVEEAIPFLDRAIQLDRNLAIAYFLRAGAYSELQNRSAAVKDYQQAGRLYEQQENRASFDRVLAIVRELVPSCYPNCNRVGSESENLPVATDRELLKPSVSSQPISNISEHISFGEKIFISSLSNRHKKAGVAAYARGDFATAIAKLEASLHREPNDPETLIYLNNARIGHNQSYSLAVSVPIDSLTPNALEILRGVAQGQNQINQENGIKGIPLKIAIAADDNNPEVTKQIAETLAQNPDILGIVGPFSSDAALVAGEVFNRERLVAISPTSTSVKLSNFSPYFFRTAPSDALAARALADYAIDELQTRKAAVFFNSGSAYSQSLKEEFLLALSQRGGNIVRVFDLSEADFNARRSIKIAQEQGAEVLMLAPNTPMLDKAIKVIRANKQKLPLLGGDAVYQSKTLVKGQKNAVGIVVASPWSAGNRTQSNFLDRARTLWGEEVSWRAALAYDATQAFIAAISSNPSRIGIQKTLASSNFTVDGSSGKIGFLPSGDSLRYGFPYHNSSVELVHLIPSPNTKYGYNFVPLSP